MAEREKQKINQTFPPEVIKFAHRKELLFHRKEEEKTAFLVPKTNPFKGVKRERNKR